MSALSSAPNRSTTPTFKYVPEIYPGPATDLLGVLEAGYKDAYSPRYAEFYANRSPIPVVIREAGGEIVGASLIDGRRVIMSAPIDNRQLVEDRIQAKVELLTACRDLAGAAWATIGENRARVMEAYELAGMRPVFDYKLARDLIDESVAPWRSIEETPQGYILLSDLQSGHVGYRQRIMAWPEC